MKARGLVCHSAETPIEAFDFTRRAPRDNDVVIDIQYCGICGTDLHRIRNDWGASTYPMVPGHEIVGRVSEVGPGVTRYKKGDLVAVGCLVDSCRTCDQCETGAENLCRAGNTRTYDDNDRVTGEPTYGGYSSNIVVREEFVLRVPEALDPAGAAPLLCAGVTAYSALKMAGIKAGSRIAIAGIGGIGHLAVKIAAAFGAQVTVMSRSTSKQAAAHELGAHAFLDTADEEALKAAASGFDIILDTIPVKHDINPFMRLLDLHGALVLLGQVGPLVEPNTAPILLGRRKIMGSAIGGIPETQETLDFCGRHGIVADCEIVGADAVNEALERMDRSDVKYRFVIDMDSLH